MVNLMLMCGISFEIALTGLALEGRRDVVTNPDYRPGEAKSMHAYGEACIGDYDTKRVEQWVRRGRAELGGGKFRLFDMARL